MSTRQTKLVFPQNAAATPASARSGSTGRDTIDGEKTVGSYFFRLVCVGDSSVGNILGFGGGSESIFDKTH
jgi:hypothetical protein